MSKKYTQALNWALKSNSKDALEKTIKVILESGYTKNDIIQVLERMK